MNRLSLQEVLRLRAQRETQFEKDTRVTKAYTVGVDFVDSCRVDGREGYKWVREYGVNGGVFQVAGVNVQDRVNLPVLVGYDPKEPYKRMIISVDWSWVIDLPGWQDGGGSTPGEPFLPNHATSHEWPDYAPGPDAVNTYLRALTPLRVYPGTGLSISVAPYTYDVMDGDGVRQLLRYPGESNIDITMYQPASGFQVALLVYLDRGADAIGFAVGTAVVDVPTLTPPNPVLPDNAILLAIIRLSGDAAAIFESNISDIRQLWDYYRPDYGQAIYDLYYMVAAIEGGTIYGGGSGSGYPFNVITVDAVNPEADYDNVPAAIAVAISGDVISIGPGVYTCDNQSLPAGVDLIGHGPGITILYTEGTTALTVNTGSFIQDIEIQSITTSIDSKPVIIAESIVTLYNVHILAYETTASDDAWAVTINGGGITLRNCYLQVLDGDTLRGIVATGTVGDYIDVIGGRIDTGGDQDVYAPSGHRVVLQYVYTSAPFNGGVTGDNVYGNTLSWIDGSHTWWAGDSVRVRLHSDLNFQLAQGVDIYAFSDDHYLSGASSKVVPTERAVKEYVDSQVISGDYVLKTGDTMTGQLFIDGAANETQLLVQGHSTQTAPIINIENSAGTDLLRVGEGVVIGSGTVPAAGNLTLQNNITIGGLTSGRIPYATTGGLIGSTANLQWDVLNNRMGVGMTPVHTLDVTTSLGQAAIRAQRNASTPVDVIRAYNPNTTNGNAAILSFSSNTSGTGATSDVTFGDIRGLFSTHNNSTSTGSLLFSTRQTNVLATRMTVGNGVMVGTVTDPGAGKLAVQTQIVLPATGDTGGILIGGNVNIYTPLPNILKTDDTVAIGEAHTLYTSGELAFNQQQDTVRLLFLGSTDAYLLNVMGSTDRVGIGADAPENKLHVRGGSIQVDNSGAAADIDQRRYSADVVPSIHYIRKARGTLASPATVAAGDFILNLTGQGYEATTPTFRNACQILMRIRTGSTPSNTSMPGEIQLNTVTDSSTTVQNRVTVRDGILVGSPTGGDKGTGTINAAGDVYKNNSAYTNPDYVLEHYYTGRIERFAASEGADAYTGILPLAELAGYLRDNLHLPGRNEGPMGIFERSDMAQRWLEEVAVYITQLHERLEALEC